MTGMPSFLHCSWRQGCHRRATTFSSLMQFRAFAQPGVGRLLAEAMTNCLPWGKTRACTPDRFGAFGYPGNSGCVRRRACASRASARVTACPAAVAAAAWVGAAAVGGAAAWAAPPGPSARRLASAWPSAAQPRSDGEQQQAKEKSGARKEEGPGKLSHARKSKPEKPKEVKQPATKQAKLTEPSKKFELERLHRQGRHGLERRQLRAPDNADVGQHSNAISPRFPTSSHRAHWICRCSFLSTGISEGRRDLLRGKLQFEPLILAAVNAPKPPVIDRPEGDKTITYGRPGTSEHCG